MAQAIRKPPPKRTRQALCSNKNGGQNGDMGLGILNAERLDEEIEVK